MLAANLDQATPEDARGSGATRAPGSKDVVTSAHGLSPTVESDAAGNVLCALADLVSTETSGTGLSFTELAHRLDNLEGRLRHVGSAEGAHAIRRALVEIEARLQSAAETRSAPAEVPEASGEPVEQQSSALSGSTKRDAKDKTEGIGRISSESSPPSEGSGLAVRQELDAVIRDLTLRMAISPNRTLRREARLGGDPSVQRTCGTTPTPPAASTLAEIDAPGSEERRGLVSLLRRVETKIDALARNAEAEARSAEDRHRADLLARQVEATERHLVKRLDSGFSAASVETRVIEDMLRALAARFEARGQEGSPAPEQSIGRIAELVDRIETLLGSFSRHARGDDVAPAPGPPGSGDEIDRTFAAASSRIQESIAHVLERLATIEASVSALRRATTDRPPVTESEAAPASTSPGAGAVSSARDGIRMYGTALEPGFEDAFSADLADALEPDVPVEPGRGFVPPGDPYAFRIAPRSILDRELEGGGRRAEFIEAARRAARAAQDRASARPDDRPETAPEPRDDFLAKARHLASSFKRSLFP